MKYLPAERKWTGDAADEAAFRQWFQTGIESGNLDEVADGIVALDGRHGWVVARAFLEMERRYPFPANPTPEEKKTAVASRLLDSLLARFNTPLGKILDSIGVYMFENSFPNRAIAFFARCGEEYEKRDELLYLGRSWMWRGRIHSNLAQYELDMPCYGRALALIQHAFTRTKAPAKEAPADASMDSAREDAAAALSSVQHQIAVRALNLSDFPDGLLYNYRALAIRDLIKNDYLRSATYCNIGLVYSADKKFGRSILHMARSLRLDINSSNPSARRLTCMNIGDIVLKLKEPETALLLFEKALSFGFPSPGLHRKYGEALIGVGRRAEGMTQLQKAVDLHTPGSALERLDCHAALMGILGSKESAEADADAASVEEKMSACCEGLVDCLIEATFFAKLNDERLKQIAQRRLNACLASDHVTRAVLSFAVDQEATAIHETELALQQPNGVDESVRNLLIQFRDLQTQKPATTTPGKNGSTRLAGACRACSKPSEVTKGGPGPAGLCPDCQKALALEAWIKIPGGGKTGAFWITKTPVTNRLFRIYHKVMLQKPIDPAAAKPSAAMARDEWPKNWNRTLFAHPDQPMTGVNRADCEAFCAWRSRLFGRTVRLPTQDEWLRAALGDDGRKYPWGNEPPDHSRAAYSLVTDEDAMPAPVGLFPRGAGPFGALDMIGNVWEWTSSRDDRGDPIYLGGSCGSDVRDLDPRSRMFRVLKRLTEDSRDFMQLGFRCVAEEVPLVE